MRGVTVPRAVLVAYSRRVVGWSIADHLRAELVVDALENGALATEAAPLHKNQTAESGRQRLGISKG